MRIVHIDEIFHPNFGYQPSVLTKFQAMAGNDVYIITPQKEKIHPMFTFGKDTVDVSVRDAEWEQATGCHVIRVPIHRYISNRAWYKNEVFKVLKQLKPDFVMCHLLETIIPMKYIAKGYYKKYPTVFDSHMLRMASRNRFSSVFTWFFKHTIAKTINRRSLKVIRTQDDDYVNAELGIKEDLTPFVSFGTDTILFHPDSNAKREFRKENNIDENAFVILYTGKLDDAKGGLFLAKTLLKRFNMTNREVVFVIVGSGVGKYGEEVDEAFRQSENRIIRFPTQRYMELGRFYQAADLSIFAKQCSLSFFDAQACGLPVVFEDNNINLDRARYANALTFEAGNVEDFREKIQRCIDMEQPEFEKMKQNAIRLIKDKYDYSEIEKQYAALFEEEYRRFHAKKKKG